MRTTAATPWIVVAVGTILIIAAVGSIFGIWISPTNDRIAAATARYKAAFDDSTDLARTQAENQLAANTKTANGIRDQWKVKEKALMPPYDVSKRNVAWAQLSRELSYNLGPSLERWMARSGVVQLSSIAIKGPPNSPNGIDATPLRIPIAGESGSMSVGGDFRALLGHVLKWNDFNRLVLVDRVELHGNSPFMTAQYSAQVIIFPQNADKLGQAVSKSGSGGGTGAYGGGGGGMGGPGGFGGMQ